MTYVRVLVTSNVGGSRGRNVQKVRPPVGLCRHVCGNLRLLTWFRTLGIGCKLAQSIIDTAGEAIRQPKVLTKELL